ncbi:beta-xylosidase family glycoside hydrolase [Anaerocolumna sedimenticola]|uniref:beta-xylosidase family glycoside hydrolase n=1 Tax=Anaerocolumna sedimenticola TaxID=2696063 RepID=UPI002FE6DFDA
MHFQSLRVPPFEDSLSLKERPGYLRLKGRESLGSKFHQSLIARRQQAFKYTAITSLEFSPDSFQQMAGLIAMYDINNYFYLNITFDEEKGKVLSITTCDNGNFDEPVADKVPLGDFNPCYLKVDVDYHLLQFYYSTDETDWIKFGPVFDASILSDEYTEPSRFTGAFVGLCCQDLSGQRKPADFDFFDYRERD